jgi:hypothetical protein
MREKGINSLFIGREHLNLEGRDIKHISLIRKFGILSPNKTSNEPMEFIGLDLETDHKTGELKLLGFWEDNNYSYFTNNFLSVIYNYVKKSIYDNKNIVWWNRLDPFIILKQFLIIQKDNEIVNRALMHYGKIPAEWDNKNKKFIVKPVISVIVGDKEFGIMNAIRSSIQFYIKKDDEIKTCWAYDVAQMYMSGLEKEATSRFSYYSKVDESAHLVSWALFEIDDDYKHNIVLKSNMLDARAVTDLAKETLKEFYTAFKAYPKTLISQGSLARSALMAQLNNMGLDAPKEARKIGIYRHIDKIFIQLGADKAKNLLSLVTEAYSAGYIEAIRFGYAEKGAHADIASAYPATIVQLYDLTGAKYEYGKGIPERAKKGYTFIRGYVDVPESVTFNPITIKHPVFKETNIRASGYYRASYTIEERDFMESQGATFNDEEWFKIETNGNLSPLAKVAQEFIELRKRLLAENNSAQYMAKIASNSLYGILFEAVDTYEEGTFKKTYEETIKDNFYKDILKHWRKKIDFTGLEKDLKYYLGNDYPKIRSMWHGESKSHPEDVKSQLEYEGIFLKSDHPADILLEINDLYRIETKKVQREEIVENTVLKSGYRAGEFFNPIYATFITAQTRILLAKGALEIENNGGKVIALMTDSITWQGTPDQLPNEYVKEEKTLGYFEKPDTVSDIICLGAGRYGFKTEKGYMVTKQRGLAVSDNLDWKEILNNSNDLKYITKTRALVSVGMILGNHEYKVPDLGRIVEVDREVDLIVGLTKRPLKEELDINKMKHGLIDTVSFHIGRGMLGNNDLTLPELRDKLKRMQYELKADKVKRQTNQRQKRFYEDNKQRIRQEKRDYMRNKRAGLV